MEIFRVGSEHLRNVHAILPPALSTVARDRRMQCEACDESETGSLGSDVSGFSGLTVQSCEADDTERLALRIYRKLQTSANKPLAMAHHRSAVSTMVALKDILQGTKTQASPNARMALLCAGIECQRRVVLRVDDPVTHMHLQTTVPLLFALVVMSEGIDLAATASSAAPSAPPSAAPSAPPSVAPSVVAHSLASEQSARSAPQSSVQSLDFPSSVERRRVAAWKAMSLDKELLSCHASEYTSNESICRIIMRESKLRGRSWDIQDLSEMAEVFFQCSSKTMTYNLLKAEPSRDKRQRTDGFVTLDTMGLVNISEEDREKRLCAIVDAAESEAGQQARSAQTFPTRTHSLQFSFAGAARPHPQFYASSQSGRPAAEAAAVARGKRRRHSEFSDYSQFSTRHRNVRGRMDVAQRQGRDASSVRAPRGSCDYSRL